MISTRSWHHTGGDGELDDAPAGVIARDVLAAELPESGIKIADVDHVAGGIAHLDAVADAIGAPNQQINPADETGHRCLHGQAENDRTDAERGQRSIPVNEND